MAHFSQIDDGANGTPFQSDAWKWQIPLSVVAAALWFLIERPIMAAGIVLSIAVHEAGHWLAAKARKAETGGFFLVPLIGGCCRVRLGKMEPVDIFWVAAAGPFFGALVAIPFAFFGQDDAAILIVGLNLFQLIPVVPLDGGRMLMAVGLSISQKAGAIFGVGAALIVGTILAFQGEWGWFVPCVVFGIAGSIVIAYPRPPSTP